MSSESGQRNNGKEEADNLINEAAKEDRTRLTGAFGDLQITTGSSGATSAEDARKKEIDDCIKAVKDNVKELERELRILVVGAPGAGKSSFINTVAAALAQDKYRDYVTVGHKKEKGEVMTVYTYLVVKCGKYTKSKDNFKDVPLPTLVDIAGMENEDSDIGRELLKIVLFGRQHPGEALIDAYKYARSKGLKELKRRYQKNNTTQKVDRVVFVAAATEEVPDKLIKCVTKAAQPDDDPENKRSIPMFGVMTHKDKVGPKGDITDDNFRTREDIFLKEMALIGQRHRYLFMSNYCDALDPKSERFKDKHLNPDIDKPLLEFLEHVCAPYAQMNSPEQEYRRGAQNNPNKCPLS